MDVKKIRKKMGITQNAFAEMCGVSVRTVQNWENGQNIPESTLRLLEKIDSEHESVACSTPEAVMSPYPIEDAEIVGEQSHVQHACDLTDLTTDECETICPQRLPYVKSEIVQSRSTNIRHLIETEPYKLEHRSMRQMIGNPNYVQKVITSAMMPLFQPGDMLFVQFLPNDAKIISGAIYLVDTSAYGAMVRQVYVEDDYYCLHSLNPEYKELRLSRDQIYSISLVVRSLRSDFNPPLAHDVHASIHKREEQVERLLTMHEEAMAEIRRQNERMAEERRRYDERQDKLIEMLNEKK